MELLRVNLDSKEMTRESLPYHDKLLGGRRLGAQILYDEVNPNTDPLHGDNKLIMTGGIFAGTKLSSSGRFSVGAKSPLTGGAKESNSGGNSAHRLARLGYRALIIEGKLARPAGGNTGVLVIRGNDTKIIFHEALARRGNTDTAAYLQKQYPGSGFITIGPAGESMMLSACISNTDNQGRPVRMNGRGGLGAVMGAKGLKAIVLDDSTSTAPKSSKQDFFNELASDFARIIAKNEMTSNYRKYGTAARVRVVNCLGALPTYNFRRGSFEEFNSISGSALYETITERGGVGTPSHSCMESCVIRCSNIYPDEAGEFLVSPLEYETIGLIGSNLGISSLDDIAYINSRCNDLGVDTTEFGSAMGVAMDEGLFNFGDVHSVLNVLKEIEGETLRARLIASGCSILGKALAAPRVPAVKGQGMPAYDPRAIKGIGVTYATSPMGADHSAGNTVRAPLEHNKKEGQVEASKNLQSFVAAMDSLGLCLFLAPSIKKRKHLLVDLIKARLGINFKDSDLIELGRETLRLERAFNQEAGFTHAHDDLPEFFQKEENPDSGSIFDISRKEMQQAKDD